MQQMVRVAERAKFRFINLDYFRWLISYGWNLGIQMYREGKTDESNDARKYI